MAAPRVYSFLPEHLRGVLSEALAEVEHVAVGDGGPVEAAVAAVEDDDAVAFVGPFRSWHVAETAAILNEAGIAQVAPAATYAALTREEPGAEEGMPGSLYPTGERTLFRIVQRDTVVARALVASVGPRALLVADESDYGIQLASQLRMSGLEPDVDADAAVYAGLARTAPLSRLRALAPRRLYAFEGAAEGDFPQAVGSHARYALPQRGGEGFAAPDALGYAPCVHEAGMLVYGSLMAGGPSREGVLAGLRSCGRFDEHGDTVERRIGLWRWDDAAHELVPDGTIEDPG